MKVRLVDNRTSEMLVLTAENREDLEILKKLHNRTGLGLKLALTEWECVGTVNEEEVASLAYSVGYLSPKDMI
jgi:hypothetical protein